MKLAFMFLYAAALAAFGTFLLARPLWYQQWILKGYEKKPHLAKLNPMLDWMRTPSYLVVVRLVGVLCLIMALALFVWGTGEVLRS